MDHGHHPDARIQGRPADGQDSQEYHHQAQYAQKAGGQGQNYQDQPAWQVGWYREELALKNSIIDQLQKSLQDEKSLSEKIEQSADKMQLAMHNMEAFMSVQPSDDVILTAFRQLFGQVKTWVSTSLTTSISARVPSITAEIFKEYQEVFPGQSLESIVSDVLKSTKKRRFFLRGCIAETLCTEVFRSGEKDFLSGQQDLWLGPPLSLSLARFEDELAAAGAYDFLRKDPCDNVSSKIRECQLRC